MTELQIFIVYVGVDSNDNDQSKKLVEQTRQMFFDQNPFYMENTQDSWFFIARPGLCPNEIGETEIIQVR